VPASPEQEAAIDLALGLTKITMRLPTELADRLNDQAAAQGLVFPAHIRNLLTVDASRGAAEQMTAAPSGVSDADVERALLRYTAIKGEAPLKAMRAALEAAQPQPGRVDEWHGEVECCNAKGMWLIMADDCPLVPGQKVRITEDKP
jgi:hypothetical protein